MDTSNALLLKEDFQPSGELEYVRFAVPADLLSFALSKTPSSLGLYF